MYGGCSPDSCSVSRRSRAISSPLRLPSSLASIGSFSMKVGRVWAKTLALPLRARWTPCQLSAVSPSPGSRTTTGPATITRFQSRPEAQPTPFQLLAALAHAARWAKPRQPRNPHRTVHKLRVRVLARTQAKPALQQEASKAHLQDVHQFRLRPNAVRRFRQRRFALRCLVLRLWVMHRCLKSSMVVAAALMVFVASNIVVLVPEAFRQVLLTPSAKTL